MSFLTKKSKVSVDRILIDGLLGVLNQIPGPIDENFVMIGARRFGEFLEGYRPIFNLALRTFPSKASQIIHAAVQKAAAECLYTRTIRDHPSLANDETKQQIDNLVEQLYPECIAFVRTGNMATWKEVEHRFLVLTREILGPIETRQNRDQKVA